MATKHLRPMRWLLGLGVLGSALLCFGLSYQGLKADAPASHPRTGEETAEAVACFGHVDVKYGVTSLFPNQPGRVAEVPVEENQEVKAGTVLLRLENAVQALRVQEAQADLESSQAQLIQSRKLPEQHQAKVAQMRSALDVARSRLDAARHIRDAKEGLYARQLIKQTDLDVARDQVKEAEALLQAATEQLAELKLHEPTADVCKAEAEIKARQARLRQAQQTLGECELRAPTDGKVLRILVGPGEMLGTSKQAAILFCPAGPRFIRAEVEQEFAARVKVGQHAVIRDDGNDPVIRQGRVASMSDWYTHRRSILQEPLQANDVRTLECLITLDPKQPPLRIGQRVRVLIESGNSEQAGCPLR